MFISETSWQHHAGCRDGVDPEVFFPVSPRDRARIAAAKAICASCPVRSECLTDALGVVDLEGIRGGLTEGERRALQRRRADGVNLPAATPKPVTLRPPRPRETPRPDSTGRLNASPAPVGKPEYLEPVGVLVADDGTVSLSDETWARVAPVLQAHLDARLANVPRGLRNARQSYEGTVADRHRLYVAGLLDRYGHGTPWRALSDRYGPHPTLRKLHRTLVDHDRWADVLGAIGIDVPSRLAA